MEFHAAHFWSAFAASGMLTTAFVRLHDEPEPLKVNVGWIEPNVQLFVGGIQSKQYEIEYLSSDLPDLKEGDEMEIAGVQYRVRRDPYVPEMAAQGNDGTYRRALLTKL